MASGVKTAVEIPFGRFMANMLFSPICSAGAIALFIERTMMPIGPLKQVAGHFSDGTKSMEQEENLQSEPTRTSLIARCQNNGWQKADFPIGLAAALEEAAVVLAEEEVLEVLENKPLITLILLRRLDHRRISAET